MLAGKGEMRRENPASTAFPSAFPLSVCALKRFSDLCQNLALIAKSPELLKQKTFSLNLGRV
jgi:hypothetical protein